MSELDPASQAWLEGFIADHDGVAGTAHVDDGGDLRLVAAVNIPPPLLDIVAKVAHGKGMAGQAQLDRAPVQTCNLQTDTNGPFNPAARLAGGAAAVALPVLDGDLVRAVVGITFAYEGEIAAESLTTLSAAAAGFPE